MNTKKTLADAQPGGRVRLGDGLPPLPPMGYEERGTGMGPHDVYYSPVAYTAEQMRDYARAALSAQPSPGGQGNALDEVVCDLPALFGRASLEGHETGQRLAKEVQAKMRAALAARQLLGQEPAFFVNRWEMEHGTAPGLVAMRTGKHLGIRDFFTVPLYAALPAQAVDLGAVRRLLQRRMEQWRSWLPADPDAPGTRAIRTIVLPHRIEGDTDYNNDVAIYRQGIAVMDELLALIDSQAVGK